MRRGIIWLGWLAERYLLLVILPGVFVGRGSTLITKFPWDTFTK